MWLDIVRTSHTNTTSARVVLPRPWPAVTTHNPGNHAVRTEKWRYIRYADGSEELYDEAADPHEWTNLAGEAKYAGVKKELAKWLPAKEAPDAPTGGS